MAANKTQPTDASVAAYLNAIEDLQRRRDCEQLAAAMAEAAQAPAVMWGAGIVGFGRHRYPLAGGKSGEICAIGFAARKGDISVYGVADEGADAALLARLGRHKLGKGCLYIARLADVDAQVLSQLLREAAQRRQLRD